MPSGPARYRPKKRSRSFRPYVRSPSYAALSPLATYVASSPLIPNPVLTTSTDSAAARQTISRTQPTMAADREDTGLMIADKIGFLSVEAAYRFTSVDHSILPG